MTDNLRGALLMMGAMAAYVLNDATIKALAEGLPTFQVVALRGVAATAALAVLARATGAWRLPIPPADRRGVALRCAAEVAAFVPFVLALTHMPLADVTAILQAVPLTITAAGAVFLGEAVGWRRWTAIGVGFAGVLLIVQPGGTGFSPWSGLALVTVAMVTLRDLVTRRLSRDVPSLKVATFTAAAVGGLGAALSLDTPWQTVGGAQAGLILGAALFILGGYVLSVMAVRVGEIAVVSPFRYTALVWGAVLGFAVFSEVPDAATLAGGALVAATGLYTIWREGRVPRMRPTAPPPGGGPGDIA